MALNMSLAPTPEPTISDIEQKLQSGLEALRNAPLNEQITAALKYLTPSGYRPIAQLEEDRRKKRSTAAASNWNPETGEIVIYFEPLEQVFDRARAPEHVLQDSHPSMSSKRARIAEMRREVETGQRLDPILSNAVDHLRSTERRVAKFAGEPVEPLATEEQIQQCCIALAEAEKAGKAFIALKWFRDDELIAHGYAWAGSLAHRQAVLARAIDEGAVATTQIPNPKAPQHPTTTIRLNRESKYAQAVAPRFQPIQLRGEGPSASELLLRDRERL